MRTKKLRAAIVEDEFTLAILMEEMIIEMGHEVVALVASLEKGLKELPNLDIDFAVLDVNLTDGTSFPLAAILQERNIPFIFTTGYDHHVIEARFDSMPFLTKPCRFKEISEAVKLMIRS